MQSQAQVIIEAIMPSILTLVQQALQGPERPPLPTPPAPAAPLEHGLVEELRALRQQLEELRRENAELRRALQGPPDPAPASGAVRPIHHQQLSGAKSGTTPPEGPPSYLQIAAAPRQGSAGSPPATTTYFPTGAPKAGVTPRRTPKGTPSPAPGQPRGRPAGTPPRATQPTVIPGRRATQELAATLGVEAKASAIYSPHPYPAPFPHLVQLGGEVDGPTTWSQHSRVLVLDIPLGRAAELAVRWFASQPGPVSVIAAAPVRLGLREDSPAREVYAAVGAPPDIAGMPLKATFSFLHRKPEMVDAASGQTFRLQRQEMLLVEWKHDPSPPCPTTQAAPPKQRPEVVRVKAYSTTVVDVVCTLEPAALSTLQVAGLPWRQVEAKARKAIREHLSACGVRAQVQMSVRYREPAVEAILTLPAAGAMAVLRSSGQHAGVFFRPFVGPAGHGIPPSSICWLQQQRLSDSGVSEPVRFASGEVFAALHGIPGYAGLIPSRRTGHWGVRLEGEVLDPAAVERVHLALGLTSSPPKTWLRVRNAPREFALLANCQEDATSLGLGVVHEARCAFGGGSTYDLLVAGVPPDWAGARLSSPEPGVLDQVWSVRSTRQPPGHSRTRPTAGFVIPGARALEGWCVPAATSLVPLREAEQRELHMIAEEQAQTRARQAAELQAHAVTAAAAAAAAACPMVVDQNSLKRDAQGNLIAGQPAGGAGDGHMSGDDL